MSLQKHSIKKPSIDHFCDNIQDNCDTLSPSHVPRLSCSHCPPIVSVQGEAANPGPDGGHDANEANLTLFFGNI
eukprot:366036-Karenia_brevis.AAC.1